MDACLSYTFQRDYSLGVRRIGRHCSVQRTCGKHGCNWATCPTAHPRGIQCSQAPVRGLTRVGRNHEWEEEIAENAMASFSSAEVFLPQTCQQAQWHSVTTVTQEGAWASCSPPIAGATRRCPAKPSTPLEPDQVNVLLLSRWLAWWFCPPAVTGL
jgi:hypothetical protein